MDNMLLIQVFQALVNIHWHPKHVAFPELPYRIQFLLQISPVAQLGDDITVPETRQNFLAVDHVGVIQVLHDFRLRI